MCSLRRHRRLWPSSAGRAAPTQDGRGTREGPDGLLLLHPGRLCVTRTTTGVASWWLPAWSTTGIRTAMPTRVDTSPPVPWCTDLATCTTVLDSTTVLASATSAR